MRHWVIPALAVILASGQVAQGQRAPKVSGKVTDKATGNPLPKAEVILLSDSRSVLTDSAGHYELSQLPLGVSGLLVRATNFHALTVYVDLQDGEELLQPVVLDSSQTARAQQLPEVSVEAMAPVVNYRLADFERRRHDGHGQYRNEEELNRSGAYTLQDVVVPMRGVNVDCSKTTPMGYGCRIHMVRSPPNCDPEFVVDGGVDNWFGPGTPIRDIVGIEVYTGPADVPGEFAGRNSGCGVIVIWTRSGPERRAPRAKARADSTKQDMDHQGSR